MSEKKQERIYQRAWTESDRDLAHVAARGAEAEALYGRADHREARAEELEGQVEKQRRAIAELERQQEAIRDAMLEP